MFHLLFRMAAAGLAVCALFGWDWFEQYRTGPVDEWELPILSLLLFITAVAPPKFFIKSSTKLVVIPLLLIDIATFAWWFAERGLVPIANGGFDVGGIILRVFAYGLVLLLLFPKIFAGKGDQGEVRKPLT